MAVSQELAIIEIPHWVVKSHFNKHSIHNSCLSICNGTEKSAYHTGLIEATGNVNMLSDTKRPTGNWMTYQQDLKTNFEEFKAVTWCIIFRLFEQTENMIS